MYQIQLQLSQLQKYSMINSDCKNFASDDDFLKLRKKMAAEDNDDDMITLQRKYLKQNVLPLSRLKI